MEDAYVIGIRLALDNGVSAGVATIRDDLAKLDRAIAASTANIRQLQSVAAGTTAAALGQVQQPRPPEQKPQAPNEAPAPQSTPQATRQNADAPPDTLTVARPSEMATPQPSTPSPPAQTRSAPRVIAMPHPAPSSPRMAEAASTESRIAAPERVMVTMEKPAQPTDRPAISLVVTPSLGVARAPPTTAPLMPSAASHRQQEAAPTLQASSAALAISVSAPTPREDASGARHEEAQPARETPSAPSPSPPTPKPQAPNFLRMQSAPAKSIAAPMPPPPPAVPPAALPPAAPQSPSSSTGPTGGDVFLDGTRLGHWIATNLARSAGRPPSGTTGFDPRLGVTWPGTQHGGG